MKEYKEIIVEFGLKKDVEHFVEEIDKISSRLYLENWFYEDFYLDRGLDNLVLFFYREI